MTIHIYIYCTLYTDETSLDSLVHTPHMSLDLTATCIELS